MHDYYNLNDRTSAVDEYKPLQSYTLKQMIAMPDPDYLIRDIMIERGVYLLVAPPGVGKSWMEQHIALAVAMGRPLHGHTTKKGTVVRLLSERFGLAPKRLREWLASHQAYVEAFDAADVHHFGEPIELHEPHSVERFIRDLEWKGITPSLLTVDTLAQNMAGRDDNSAMAMGLVMKGVGMLRDRLGCAVLLVHHTGKDGSSERGSNAPRGYADGLWMLRKDRASTDLVLRCVKENWGPGFERMKFKLVTDGKMATLEEVLTGSIPPASLAGAADTAADGTASTANCLPADEALALAIVRSNAGKMQRKNLADAMAKPGPNSVCRSKAYQVIDRMIAGGRLDGQGRMVLVTPATDEPASTG
jgi:hypothetical protein